MRLSGALRFVGVIGIGLASATAALAPRVSHASGVPSFDTAMLPPAPGLNLPHNEDAEPGMAIDGGGTIWIASDIEPYAADDPRAQPSGVLSGSDVWKSTDGGHSYQFVAAPFTQIQSNQSGAGGEDTDIAASPVANSSGCYDIWVASLWIGSTNLAVSQDCGATFVTVPVNGEPAQDRPWLAADGACTVYLSYHALAPYDTVVDTFSLPPCNGQAINSAVPPTQADLFLGNVATGGLTNRHGKIVVDTAAASPFQHNVYQPMQGCASPTVDGVPEAALGCSTAAQILMGVSTNGGVIWNDYTVHVTTTTTLYIWPVTAAVDSAGNIYVAWMEGSNGFAQNSFISVSKDGGKTWSAPVQINAPPSLSSAYPTLAANEPGHVEAAWYGTDRNGGTDDQNVMGLPALTTNPPCGATGQPACWRLWWGTSSDYGSTWTEGPVTGTVHTGILCVEGGGCTASNGDRNMLDDFGMVIDGKTGAAAVMFDNDQPESLQGKTHTDFAVENVLAANTPELLSPLLAVLGGATLTAGVVARRRRAMRSPIP